MDSLRPDIYQRVIRIGIPNSGTKPHLYTKVTSLTHKRVVKMSARGHIDLFASNLSDYLYSALNNDYTNIINVKYTNVVC